MAKSRSPLFSLEARGSLAGLQVAHHRKYAQVLRERPAHPPPSSPLQLQYQARVGPFTHGWRSPLTDLDRQAWDAYRRHMKRPGTGYSEFMRFNLSLWKNIPGRYLYAAAISRWIIPGRIIFAVNIDAPMGLDHVDYGPTPSHPSHSARLFLWPPAPLFLANVPDLWPGKRIYARMFIHFPFSFTPWGATGTYTASAHG